jgi:[acyl-carrier-protein] S-malonyltransferase
MADSDSTSRRPAALPSGPPTTIVFPGQGSQRAGMGRDFFDRFRSSRRVYEEAADAAGFDVAALCFSEDARLSLTEYSQPAILTTQIAMVCALAEGWGVAAQRFGGHSLGEYSALVAAGVVPLADAVRLVRERGRLMQAAVPAGEGCMAAVLGSALDRSAIAECLAGLGVDVANDNSDGQVVLSGPVPALRQAGERVVATAATGAERIVELDVSAPFHSRRMQPIEAPFASVLADACGRWNTACAPSVTSNLTGGFHDADAALVCERLVGQLSATVRWRDNMNAIAADGGPVFEVGPSRPLRGFFRTIGVDVVSIVDVRSAGRAFSNAERAVAA